MFLPFLLYIGGINWDTRKKTAFVLLKTKMTEGLYMNASLLLSASVFLSTASATEATLTRSLIPTWPT